MIGRCTAPSDTSLRVTTGLFVDPAHQRAFDDLYTRITGEGRRRLFSAAAFEAKELMLRTALASETNVLARALNRIGAESTDTRLHLERAAQRPARGHHRLPGLPHVYHLRWTRDIGPRPARDRAGGSAGQATQPGLRPVRFRFPG